MKVKANGSTRIICRRNGDPLTDTEREILEDLGKDILDILAEEREQEMVEVTFYT